jgi:xylan 1,4-beta-xylosidase
MDCSRLFRRSGSTAFRFRLVTAGATVVFAGCCSLWSQPAHQAPVIGKSLRYCNPLPLETSSKDGSPQGVSLGDVTVVRDGASYYLFGTGGGAWISSDLVNWKYQAVEVKGSRIPVAPHVFKFNGAFYLSGNNAPLYKSASITGPYELFGPWTDEKGQPWKVTFNGTTEDAAFDVDVFVDDDNKPYLYFPGRSTAGIYVAPLDPNHLNHLTVAPKHLFGFDSKYVWERWGEKNEYTGIAWIEGPWMFKRNGTYYIEFSASGTQWLSYASGIYSSKSPLGPFAYSPRNPLLRKTTGTVTGPGHGSVVQGPDGNWWVFYTIVMSNPPGGRRIGMDPIAFDGNGNPYTTGPSETPQWAPGAVSDPVHNGDSGSVAVSINKLRAMHGQSSFSSERPGHEAAYATDDSNGTVWQPAESDVQPTLTLDLVAPTEFETGQYFEIDSSRIECAIGSNVPRMAPGAGLATPQPGPTGSAAFRYKIETSMDGKQFTTVVDKTSNATTRYTEFDEIPPTRCRFIRLTITDWPHRVGSPLGVTEFTVFGKALATPMH